jgi:hypothetical protein
MLIENKSMFKVPQGWIASMRLSFEKPYLSNPRPQEIGYAAPIGLTPNPSFNGAKSFSSVCLFGWIELEI